MRPSRELGVAVLLMLGASGCAGVPQRTGLGSSGFGWKCSGELIRLVRFALVAADAHRDHPAGERDRS